MTPEERQLLNELIEWKRQKETQQLSYPVDDASKGALGALIEIGTAATPTQTSVGLTGNPQTINVPKNPDGLLQITGREGTPFNIPYYL